MALALAAGSSLMPSLPYQLSIGVAVSPFEGVAWRHRALYREALPSYCMTSSAFGDRTQLNVPALVAIYERPEQFASANVLRPSPL